MLKQIFFALVVILAILLLLEGGSRLIESALFSAPEADTMRPGWQAEFFGSLFDWHEPDPELLWRFRAGLKNPLITTNSDHLLGPEISAGKPENGYRVLILGDSSPAGLGLKSRRQTFGEIFRFLLDGDYKSHRQVEVVNAAVSGYSSEQIRCFLENRGWKYDPDLIVLYCGNNDASISGEFSDHDLLAGQKLKSLRSFFSHLALYRVMRAVIKPQPESGGGDLARLKVRVSPEEYGANLGAIVKQAQEHDCPLVILKPPVPYLWPAGLQFKPFLHFTGGDGEVLLPEAMAAFLGKEIVYCIDTLRLRELYGEADIFTREVYSAGMSDAISTDSAVSRYLSKSVSEPDNPIWLNDLGVAWWKMGKFHEADSVLQIAIELFHRQAGENMSPAFASCASPILYNLGITRLCEESASGVLEIDTGSAAFALLDSALQSDYFSLRIKRRYWNELDKFRVARGVMVIDLPEIFSKRGGETLFIDHCHPTAEGHLLIAETVYDSIRTRHW